MLICVVCRVEKKERARLKSVKFHGRSADAKGVSIASFLLIVAINSFSFAVPNGQYKCQLVLKGGVAF